MGGVQVSVCPVDKDFNIGNNQEAMKPNRYLIVFSVVAFAFVLNGCKPTVKIKKSGSLRLIDHLNSKNIETTPFKDLILNFPIEEENLTGKFVLFRELSSNEQKVWAAPTKKSVLSFTEEDRPQDMEVFFNDESLPFFGEEQENSAQWKLIKTTREYDIKQLENYSRNFNCLILDENEHFGFETILSPMAAELEILVRRNRIPQQMEVFLDDKKIAEEPVKTSLGVYRIPIETTLGTHKLSLKSKAAEDSSKNDRQITPRILIYDIRIKTDNDLLLLLLPSKHDEEFLKGKISIKYHSDRDQQGEENPLVDLYRMKYDFMLDKFESDQNPENIKKKLSIEDLTLETLMASPPSRFELDLRTTSENVLEFGIGIFTYRNIEETLSTTFSIMAEGKDFQETIYSKKHQLQPGNQRNQIVLEKVDLSSFANKSIKLSFITEGTEGNTSMKKALSFWYNPVIYQPNKEGPKVILIVLDTLRSDHLGCYGYERDTSPNIDTFISDCAVFENAYAQSPWTLPSHVSILYSLNSANHQVYYNDQKIDNSLVSSASFFRKNGYFTHAFTGGGYTSNIYGFSKGFDWYEEPVGGRYAPLPIDEAEKLFDYTSQWIKNNKDKKFFLFLHTFQIHGPYICPSPWNEMFLDDSAKWNKMYPRIFLDTYGEDYPFSQEEINNIISLYDGEIRYTDETLIMPLLSLLKELGIYENSMIIITSDHGEEFYDHAGWLHGSTVYNEQIHVPLVIKFPKQEFKGTRVKPICRLIDIMPTIFEALSIPYPKGTMEGKSLMSLVLGDEREDRTFISDLAYKSVPDPCPSLIATNQNQWKLIVEKSKEGIKNIEFYNLEEDRKEKINMLGRHRDLSERMISNLDEYYQKHLKLLRHKEKVILDEKLKEKLRALGYIR